MGVGKCVKMRGSVWGERGERGGEKWGKVWEVWGKIRRDKGV